MSYSCVAYHRDTTQRPPCSLTVCHHLLLLVEPVLCNHRLPRRTTCNTQSTKYLLRRAIARSATHTSAPIQYTLSRRSSTLHRTRMRTPKFEIRCLRSHDVVLALAERNFSGTKTKIQKTRKKTQAALPGRKCALRRRHLPPPPLRASGVALRRRLRASDVYRACCRRRCNARRPSRTRAARRRKRGR